ARRLRQVLIGTLFMFVFLLVMCALLVSHHTSTTELYTLSLHDALPICTPPALCPHPAAHQLEGPCAVRRQPGGHGQQPKRRDGRSEEHTSELQSPDHLVCRLLLEKKKKHT